MLLWVTGDNRNRKSTRQNHQYLFQRLTGLLWKKLSPGPILTACWSLREIITRAYSGYLVAFCERNYHQGLERDLMASCGQSCIDQTTLPGPLPDACIDICDRMTWQSLYSRCDKMIGHNNCGSSLYGTDTHIPYFCFYVSTYPTRKPSNCLFCKVYNAFCIIHKSPTDY